MEKCIVIILCMSAMAFGLNKRYLQPPQVDTVGLVAHYKLYAGPTGVNTVFDYSLNGNEGTWQGAELITNGDFANWTGVDPDAEPDNWTVTGTDSSNDHKLVDATNACQLITTDGAFVQIAQTILTVGKTYSFSISISAITGGLTLAMGGGNNIVSYTTTGTKTGTFVAVDPDFQIKRAAVENTDVTFTNISVRAVLEGSYPGVLFDGADNKITVSADPTIDANGKTALTISAWINPASGGENDGGRVIDKISGDGGYVLFVGDEVASAVQLAANVLYDGVSDSETTTTARTPINTWTHVAMVHNEDSAKKTKIYFNGVLQALTTDNAGVGTIDNDSAVDLTIGNLAAATTRTFDGLIDDVRIYNVAKSAAEVKSIFETTRWRYSQ